MKNLTYICIWIVAAILICSECQVVIAEQPVRLNRPWKNGGSSKGPSKAGNKNSKKKSTNNMNLNDGTVDGPWALLIGLGPFGKVKVNPAETIVAQLPKEISGIRLVKCVLDVEYGQADALFHGLSGAYGKGGGKNAASGGGKNAAFKDSQLPPILFQQSTPPLFLIHISTDPEIKKFDLISMAVNYADEADNLDLLPPTELVSKAYPLNHVLTPSLPLRDIRARVGKKQVQISDDPGSFVGNYNFFKSLEFKSSSIYFLVCLS